MLNRTAIAVIAALFITTLPLPAVPSAGASGGASAAAYAHYYGPSETTTFPDELPIFILAGEPSVGVNWNTGNAFFQHGFDTYRVAFDDTTLTASWTDVTPPNSEFNVDPLLFTDSTTGRTYAGGLDGVCSIMSYTDDDGESWTPTGNACVATLDHQSIVSGPWRTQAGAPATLAPHDRAVYYCAQANFVTCATSFDGGLTFPVTTQVSCSFANPGFHGSLHIGPFGHVFLPFKNCGGQIGVAVSANNGVSWTARQIPGTVTPAAGFDPDVATSTGGWLYAGFRNGTGGAYASLSKNNGTSWTTPVNVGASLGIVNTTFHEMVAGDNDRATLAFLGTTTPGNAFADGFAGVWHLYTSTTHDGGATWTTQQVTTDPVQRGWICASGTTCNTGRNLLDFMDAQLDKEGRVLIAYVDGCIAACAGPSGTAAQSDSAAAVITRQVSGDTLFSAYDGQFGGLRALPGGPYSTTTGIAAPISGLGVGGAGSYTYAWSMDAAPAGSSAGAASFASPTSAATTFTPDVDGSYTLRLTVTDSATTVASATATLTASPTTPAGPILSDPAGDNNVNLIVVTVNGGAPAGTDIRGADVIAETATDFTIELQVADLALSTGSTASVLGIPFGAQTIYTVGFQYAESPTNTVNYQVAASKFEVATPGDEVTFELQVTGTGTTNFVSSVAEITGIWDAENDRIVWTIPKNIMTVKTAPTGAGDAGVMTGGSIPTTGDVLDNFNAEVRTWFFALVGLGPGATIWDSASGGGSYTMTE